MAERVLTGVAPGSLAAAARPDRRQLGVDAMRGLAALCVVVYHGTPHGPGANYVVPYEGTLLQCLDYGVLVFFVISGLLVGGPFVRAVVDGRRMPSVRDFALRRGARIFPAYWVALAAVILIGGTASAGDVLLHGALMQNFVPGEQGRLLYQSWTLEIELFFYASVALTAFVVVHRLRRQVSPDVLAAAVVAVWGLSFAVTLAADLVLSVDSRWASVAKYTFPAQVGYICPGLLLAIAGTEAARRRGGMWRVIDRVTASPRLALLVIAGFGAVGGLMTARFEVMPRDLHRHAFAVSAAVLVATVARHERAVRRYVRWVAPLGVVAYSLYLWHAIVLMAAKRAGIYPLDLRGWHLGVVAQPVSLVLLVAASIAAAAVSYALVERPALRWSVHRSPDGGILGAQPATVAPLPVEAPAPVG